MSPACEGSVLFGIGAAPFAVPLDRCVPVPEFRILSRTSGFGMSPGFRLISVVPGSWEFWGPVPVLVPVPVDSPAELLEVLVEKPDRFRRCFWEIPESRFKAGPADSGSDLDRIKAGPADSGSDLDWIKAGPADSGSVGLLENRENRPSDSRLDSSGS